ncbi:unnamed protein product [Callosobruchus maculatus]|uniref:Uncharacterized protein n=1 Tax=Callosobruchus maculatus TaxID=64391 RepID=A0A653D9R5_CALMS|nr:unnamed protein product [Callosobruchus maculatus]
MQRIRAKTISENTEKIVTTCEDESNLATKLLEDNGLNLDNVRKLSYIIADEEGYQKNQLVVCECLDELKEHLSETDTLALETPVFVIHCNDKNFVTFSIVKLDDKFVCLYKDFYGTQVSEPVRRVLGQSFGANIDYKVNPITEIIKNHEDIGTLALETLRIMMTGLKTDTRMDFISTFTSNRDSYLRWVIKGAGNLKNLLFSKLENSYYRVVASDIDQLSRDEKFKNAISHLMNSIPSSKVAEDVESYHKLLKKFVEIEVNGISTDIKDMTKLNQELENAREVALSATKQIELKAYKTEDGRELDIVKEFPEQMEKFTNIFKPLIRCEVDDSLEETLEDICKKLGLDSEKVRSFFKSKKETLPDPSDDEEDIEHILDSLPSLEAKHIICKPLDQLISEVRVEKSDVSVDVLKEGYGKVKDFHRTWCIKGAGDINQWAINKKGKKLDLHEVYEAVAVMDRANEFATGGHRFRDTQILSVLAFLQQKDKGLLSQIETGEGKTTIVATLAAFFALQGSKVDVITSNPILASDVVKDKKHFYRLLNLTVSTNNLDENYNGVTKQCYEADIVYGSISNFQFHYLRDSFSGLDTRGGRPFDKIILDEVDCMIIDNASHIAKISNPSPGMESLKYVYINIWQALQKAEAQVAREFQEELKLKAHEFLESHTDQFLLYETYINEFKDSILRRIKTHIRSSNPTDIDIIPSHIREYAKKSLDRWIDSAINAKFHYERDVQYIIGYKDGEKVIQPVDYSNTGITLKNTIWQYGLHQFLQLKHNLRLTSESLTNCFISNLGYINKYGRQIFGVTGTLGSEAERELLSSIYKVGYLEIPTLKEKQLIEMDGEVVEQEIFCERIADDAISVTSKCRSVLIICETIKDAKAIEGVLKRKQENTIHTFFNEESAHITEKQVEVGEVIIATNIAGRGTDFKTSTQLDSNGGLHVSVAYLPCNKRVEDQACGRTARQGNKGSAKLIIKKDEVTKLNIDTDDFEEIKRMRDMKEKERIKDITKIKIPQLIFQDRIFELFATLYSKLVNEDNSDGEYRYVLKDLKEFWAFWLEKRDFQGDEVPDKSLEEEFKVFETEASDIIMGKIKFNPYYSIQQAEHYILNGKLDLAKDALNHAIAISENPEILYSAYMKLFDVAISEGGVFIDRCKKALGDIICIPNIKPNSLYKQDAKRCLDRAIEAIKKELDYIEGTVTAEEFSDIINNDDIEWFTDDDMHVIGEKILCHLVENINTQFVNRLTEDQINTFCKERQLMDNVPVFVCYNVRNIHWVGMCIIKTKDSFTLFYKDPKGDFESNLEVVQNTFRIYFEDLKVIAHRGSEQKDGYSCGLLTLENLRIMAKSLKDNGVEVFMENFSKLTFSQQEDVARLRKEFSLHSGVKAKKNILLKHIASRQALLDMNMRHAKSLLKQIDEHEGGIVLSGRIPDYFSELKPESYDEAKIKDTVANSELSELAEVGANIIYGLREVQDVPSDIIKGAQIQIGTGIGVFVTGCCFPPAFPVVTPIAGMMIGEGVCDVIVELIRRGNGDDFNLKAYVKGKVISYALSLFTLGCNIVLQCPKILNAAKNACSWLSATLRKCPYFKAVCEYMATNLDKIHAIFERLETLAVVNNLRKEAQSAYLEDLQPIQAKLSLQKATIDVGKNITLNTLENIIINQFSVRLKLKIKTQVEGSVRRNINEEKLSCSSFDEIQSITKRVKTAVDSKSSIKFLKDSAMEITKYCKESWIVLVLMAIENYLDWTNLYNYVEDLCKGINNELNSSGESKTQSTEDLVNQLVEQLSEDIYSEIEGGIRGTCKALYSIGESEYQKYLDGNNKDSLK